VQSQNPAEFLQLYNYRKSFCANFMPEVLRLPAILLRLGHIISKRKTHTAILVQLP
jgi:hypothetical protein